MRRNLLGFLARAVRFLMVFRTRPFGRVPLILQYVLLDCLGSYQQHNGVVDIIFDPLCALTRPCRHATCDERKELSVVANVSDQVLLCFAEDVRLRNTVLVCRLSCLFCLQSDHST